MSRQVDIARRQPFEGRGLELECDGASFEALHGRGGERAWLKNADDKGGEQSQDSVIYYKSAPDLRRVLLIASDRCRSESIGMLRHQFEAQCAGVSTFEEAQDGIPALYQPGVIVVSGYGATEPICERVNALRDKAARPLPVVLLASELSFASLKKVARRGPIDVLSETVGQSELLSAVQNALDWFAPYRPNARVQHNVLNMLEEIEARLSILTNNPVDGQNGRPALRRRADKAYIQLQQAGIDCEMIKAVMQFRSAQEDILGGSLIDDAAWVMLLDLLLMYLERKKLAVTSLYIGSGAPVATALRRLNQLLDKDLAIKVPDPSDRRRTLVEITPKGVEGVCAVLSHMKNAFVVTACD